MSKPSELDVQCAAGPGGGRGAGREAIGRRAPRAAFPLLAVLVCAIGSAIGSSPAGADVVVGVHEASFTPEQAGVLARTKAKSVRTDLAWSDVQPCRGGGACEGSRFDFGRFDERYEALSKAGLGPEYLTLISAPRWATSGCRKTADFCTPSRRHLDAWKGYVGRVLLRYGPQGSFWKSIDAPRSHRITNFVLWNEPNHRKNWNGKASPREYRRLLAVTRSVFDRVAPAARLNAGNVAYGGRSTKPPSWLRILINRTSAERDFDTLAIHPYSRTPEDVVRKTLGAQRLHGIQRVAITEIGWGIDKGGSGRTNAKCVRSEREQAGRLTNTFRLLGRRARELVWVSWFDAIDNDTGSGCNNSPSGKTFGLFEDRASQTPYGAKSSLAAFNRFAPSLRRR